MQIQTGGLRFSHGSERKLLLRPQFNLDISNNSTRFLSYLSKIFIVMYSIY